MAVNTGNVEIKACVCDSCTANVELPGTPGSHKHPAFSAIHWPTPVSSLESPAGFSCPVSNSPPHHPGRTIGETLDVGFFTTLTRWKPCPSPPTAAGAVPIATLKAGLTLMTCPG